MPTVLGMVHPWRRFRALAEWTLCWHHPDEDRRLGVTRYSKREISLRSNLTWEERRCTIFHEALHAERGPTLEGVLHEREEHRIRKLTARELLPSIDAVGEAMAWAHLDIEAAAHELWVDEGVLRDRLRHLHPAERHKLTRRLDGVESF